MPTKEKIEYALTLERNKFNKGLKLAAGRVDKMSRDMKRAMAPVKTQFANIGKGLAIGVAAGVAAAIISIGKLKSFASDAVDLSNIQEGAEIRLAGVLKATGEAAGFTLPQLKAYASELQEITAVGDEVTLSNMAILASFKEIKGDQFKEATKAAIDMSKVMGTDLKSSIIQVGKALNDPAIGLTALSRSGVTFSKSQQDVIKALAATGHMAEAQNLILKELQSQFGGVAEALRKGFEGSIDAAVAAFGDLKEELGEVITKNKFFIESANIIKDLFQSWDKDIQANKQEWMLWAKESALAVMEFTADFGDGISSVYKSLQRMSGALSISLAGTILLGKGFQKLFELANKFSGNEDKAKYWAEAQQQSAGLIENAFKRASEAFANADKGLPFVDKAVGRIRELKAQLATIAPEYVETTEQMNEDTKTVEKEVVKIGDTYVEVFKVAKKEESAFFQQAMRDLERLQAEAAKVKIGKGDSSSSGYAKGGDPFYGGLGGYGGGDRRMILVEDGEHVIRKEAVKKLGHGFFQRFNALRFPKIEGFATGGAIGVGAGVGTTYNVNFSFSGSVSQGSQQNARDIAKMVLAEFKSMHRGAS